MIITKREFDDILKRKEGITFLLKVDFGLNEVEVIREKTKAIIAGSITLDLREKIKDNVCYLLDNQGLRKIAFFSSETNYFYKLSPTSDWPTAFIGSVPMHKVISAKNDTENKVNLIRPKGYVLDTCMGLGYTAIGAAERAKEVITFEKDENMVFLAKLNPLSRELFTPLSGRLRTPLSGRLRTPLSGRLRTPLSGRELRPKGRRGSTSCKIRIIRQDIVLYIGRFKDDYFDCIIHDPPTFKLAPQLYTLSFYRQLNRILKRKGRLFHYAPLYKIKTGFNFPGRIKTRLKEAGFKIIGFFEAAQGFLCQK